MQLLQRNKEAAQFEEWERQEDQFHLEQARLRSHIRIQDGRGINIFCFTLAIPNYIYIYLKQIMFINI